MTSDVVIVGGGPAGLSAALMLGRARRSVVLLDTNQGRNAPSDASHSFFTRDGTPPADLRRIGQDQLQQYETVQIETEEVRAILGEVGNFRVQLSNDREITARTVILATGVRDLLPDIPGVERYWGKGIFQCPFCDGWEHRDQPMAVLASRDQALEAVGLYRNWSADLTLLTNGSWEPDPELMDQLNAWDVPVNASPIEQVVGDGKHATRIIFSTGSELPVAVFWIRPGQSVRNELAVALGCDLYDAGHSTGLVKLEGPGQTTVPGVFAAGDMTTPMHQVSLAVASGTMAAAGATRLLIAEDSRPG